MLILSDDIDTARRRDQEARSVRQEVRRLRNEVVQAVEGLVGGPNSASEKSNAESDMIGVRDEKINGERDTAKETLGNGHHGDDEGEVDKEMEVDPGTSRANEQ